jgi:dolichyl-phosphate beta-glucosyltransferase
MPSTKQSQKQPDLSIVIPALNEEKRIGTTLDKLAQFLKTEPLFERISYEIVLVAADANDRTHEIIEEKRKLFKRFVFLKPGVKIGKGRDVQYGMLRAQGRAILFMDADLATPLHHIPRFYEVFEQGAEVIIGTRNLRNHHHSLLRLAVANAGNLLYRVAGGVWVEDSQCGFKLFSHDAADISFSKMTIQQWGFDMEVLAIAKINKLHIKTIRIDDWQDMPDSTFDGSIIRNSLHSLKDLGYIAFNRMKGSYREQRV